MKVKNLISTNVSGDVFATIGDSFDARLWLGVPLYRGSVKKLDNFSLGYTHIQVHHEVRINKTGNQKWFSHRRGS